MAKTPHAYHPHVERIRSLTLAGGAPADSTLPRGLSVRAAAEADPELLLYDSIGPSWAGMIDADSVVRALKSLPAGHRRVVLRINSPGGDVFEAFGIYNALMRHPAEVVVEIDALAASAASIVAMAGARIRIAANAMVMVHNAWTFAAGNADDLRAVVALLDKVGDNIVATYVARTKLAAEEVRAKLDAETWMNAAEAVAQGFADEVGQELQVAAAVPAGRYKNTPERFRAPPAAAVPLPPAAPPAGAAPGLRERIALTRRRLGV